MSDHPPVKIPRVARQPRQGGPARLAITLAVVGGGVFLALANGRAARGAQTSDLPALATTTVIAPSPLPSQTLPGPGTAPLTSIVPASTVPFGSPLRPGYAIPVASNRMDDGAAERARARLAAPALIVELAQVRAGDGLPVQTIAMSDSGAQASSPTASVADAPTGRQAGVPDAAVGAIADPGARDLTSNERFATRAGNRDTEVAQARRLSNQDTLVVQGTIFGAVMETALNSDLPGYARAVTSRDVLSFDGSQVMIPAGSHVIGEYNSGVAQGASRVFIVWTRLIRPDGVSIALASPAVDDLGRGGVGGKVNRHFLQRYGGAILLSVLTGGLNAFTQSLAHGSTVIVTSSNEATSLAGQAAQSTQIPPTIKTKQGANVRIFVARDLDFSGVGPAPGAR